jgi:EAL domain-containing protein (putative c-di-GMP-specific phosphodiesterase class I)
MRAADITLYQAKEQHKGGWLRHDPQRAADDLTRHTLATAIPSALARGEFFLEYQPLVELDGGGLRGVEALVRWRSRQLGLLTPERFIGLAEQTGHVSALGRWVLTQACRQARLWQQRFPQALLCLNVNVAAGQLGDPAFVDDVLGTLAEVGLPPERLRLELTESVLLGNVRRSLEVLDELASSGIGLVIDDFCIGYSNLSRLGRLPAREIKISGSLLRTRGAPGGSADKIVSAIISLAHALELEVAAEGVESRAQADRLRLLECDLGQGWFFGPPGSPEVIERLLAARGSSESHG